MSDKKALVSAAQLAESCSTYLLQTFQTLRPDRLQKSAKIQAAPTPEEQAVMKRLGEIHRLAGEVLEMLGAR